MKIALSGFMAALAVALSACDADPPSAAVDVSSEARKIIQLESEWSDRFDARDLDGIMELIARDSVLIMPGSKPVVGAEEIRGVTRSMLDSGGDVSWRSDFAAVAPGGDMAYDYGTATTTLADGSVVEGYYLVVWTREDGRWKVAADMFN